MDRAEISSSSEARANDKRSGYRSWPVYCYVPNLIGHARVLASCIAFGVAFSNKSLFVVFYLISFICDKLDGRFARVLNQTSTFGAVLDMVTDKVSTAALLVVLTHVYISYVFLALFALDISSHWLQMYSTLIGSKASHKDMGDSKSWIVSAHYKHRIFMAFVPLDPRSFTSFFICYESDWGPSGGSEFNFRGEVNIIFIGRIAAPGCAIKQLINVVQMKAAADVTVEYGIMRDSMKVEADYENYVKILCAS